MNQLQSIYKLLSIALILFIIAAGCSVNGSSSTSPKPVAVAMQVAGSASLKTSQYNVSSGHVSLTGVKMLVEGLELENGEDDSTDFEMENQVVELPLNGSLYELSTQDIASGLYDEFELEVEGYDDNVSDPDFNDGSETSMTIKGSYNGEDFTFKTEEDFELEFEFNPPVEINENTNSVDINLMVNIQTLGLLIPTMEINSIQTNPMTVNRLKRISKILLKPTKWLIKRMMMMEITTTTTAIINSIS